MLANVTNRATGALGFATLDRGIVMLEAGASALLDLADHALHRAWEMAGQALVEPLSDKDAKAARRALDGAAASRAQDQSAALAALPAAGPQPTA